MELSICSVPSALLRRAALRFTKFLTLLISDACWLATGPDALIVSRALFERSELGRAPNVGVRPIPNGQTGRQWFWLLFPKEK